MQRLQHLISNLEFLPDNAANTARRILTLPEVKVQLIDLNLGQLKQGLNAADVPIRDYKPYAELTTQIKALKGWPFGAVGEVTLYDEGDFYAGWYMGDNSVGIFFGSNDYKASDLKKKYGKQIFGLVEASMREARIIMRPYVADEVRRQIFAA